MNPHAFQSLESLMMDKKERFSSLGNAFPNTLNIITKPTENGTISQIYINNVVLNSCLYVPAVDILLTATENDEITIFLQTPGGNVFAGIDLVNAIQATNAKLKVIANGICASCGALILFESPIESIEIREWTEVMVHGPSHFLKGKSLDIKDINDSVISWFIDRYAIYREKGLLTDEEYDQIMIKKVDVFIPAQELKNRIAAILEKPLTKEDV